MKSKFIFGIILSLNFISLFSAQDFSYDDFDEAADSIVDSIELKPLDEIKKKLNKISQRLKKAVRRKLIRKHKDILLKIVKPYGISHFLETQDYKKIDYCYHRNKFIIDFMLQKCDITSCSISADNRYLTTNYKDKSVISFDLDLYSIQKLQVNIQQLPARKKSNYSLNWGDYWANCGELINTKTGKKSKINFDNRAHLSSYSISPDNKYLVTVTYSDYANSIILWDIDSIENSDLSTDGKVISRLVVKDIPIVYDGSFYAEFNDNSEYLTVVLKNKVILLCLKNMTQKCFDIVTDKIWDTWTAATFSNDLKYLVVCYEGGSIKLFNLNPWIFEELSLEQIVALLKLNTESLDKLKEDNFFGEIIKNLLKIDQIKDFANLSTEN